MAIFLLTLFFLSGFASLVYEVLWTRLFGLLLGNTTLAVSCVLAAFFTGMAFGGFYFGRRAGGYRRPLRLFARMEVAIFVSALLILILRPPIEVLFAWLHPRLVELPGIYYTIRFIVAFLLMLPATFFMGGTLPVMSRIFIKSGSRIGAPLGLLYGVNTLGAMAGCLATAFLLLRHLGMSASFATAMGLDLAVAAAAWTAARQAEYPAASTHHREERSFTPAEKVIMTAMALSGFIAMAYEVLWSRMLVFLLTSATYSFSIMLAAFLFSIAVGGLLGGRWADRTASPLRLLGWIEIGAGASALLALFILIQLPGLQSRLFTPSPTTGWWEWNGVRFLQSFMVTSFAAILIGATFPVAVKACKGSGDHLSKTVGQVYFYNTLGGVLGSMITGLLLLSWLGAAASMAVMVALNVALGSWLLLRDRLHGGWFWLPLAVALIFMAVRLTPADLLTRIHSVAEQDFSLIAVREGIEGTVTVHHRGEGEERERRIDVDGLNVAGSSFMLRTLQLLQGHLPQMVHARPLAVLQIGFGTGQTSWAALRHPIDSFQLVEISPDVLQLSSELFRDLNQGVMCDPRFKPLILDGKNQLKYATGRYDVIMNDANYAVATASASLFTRDHFENGRRLLNPGGIFSTWMTTDLHPEDFRIVLRTFQSVFPHAVLWMAPNCINKQVVLMGSTEPLMLDWAGWQERFALAAEGLADVNITTPYDLLACLLLDERGMARLAADALINSDDRPMLEFSTRDVRARDLCAFQNLSAMMAEPPDWQRYVRLTESDPVHRAAEEERLQRSYRASRQFFQGMLQFYQGESKRALTTMLHSSRLTPESRLASGFYAEIDRQSTRLYRAVNSSPAAVGPRLELARHFIALERHDEASLILRPLLRRNPPNPAAAYEQARIALTRGLSDSARSWIEQSLADGRAPAGAWFLSGRIAEREHAEERALADYRRALTLDPSMHEAHARIGHLLLQQDNYTAAQPYLLASLQLAPSQGAVAAGLGDAALFQNRPEEATRWYRRAIVLGENSARCYHNLGNSLALLGQLEEAVRLYRIALQQAPGQAEIQYNLANALIRLNREREALILLEEAIRRDAGQADYYNNLAMLQQRMGDQIAALRTLEEGLHRFPGSILMQQNRKALLDRSNRREP